jgi:hypothetical protein
MNGLCWALCKEGSRSTAWGHVRWSLTRVPLHRTLPLCNIREGFAVTTSPYLSVSVKLKPKPSRIHVDIRNAYGKYLHLPLPSSVRPYASSPIQFEGFDKIWCRTRRKFGAQTIILLTNLKSFHPSHTKMVRKSIEKVKVKLTLERATKALRGNRCIAQIFLQPRR